MRIVGKEEGILGGFFFMFSGKRVKTGVICCSEDGHRRTTSVNWGRQTGRIIRTRKENMFAVEQSQTCKEPGPGLVMVCLRPPVEEQETWARIFSTVQEWQHKTNGVMSQKPTRVSRVQSHFHVFISTVVCWKCLTPVLLVSKIILLIICHSL